MVHHPCLVAWAALSGEFEADEPALGIWWRHELDPSKLPPGRQSWKLSESQRAQAVDMLRSGTSLREIAEVFAVTTQAVSQIAHREGLRIERSAPRRREAMV